jgi:hypothetical protein
MGYVGRDISTTLNRNFHIPIIQEICKTKLVDSGKENLHLLQ